MPILPSSMRSIGGISRGEGRLPSRITRARDAGAVSLRLGGCSLTLLSKHP